MSETEHDQRPAGRSEPAAQAAGSARNARVAIIATSVAVVMLGMAYASVPLYQMFCQVTGFAGTTQRAENAPDASKVLDRTVIVRFDANVTPGMAWKFKPLQATMDVKLGETRLALYQATNTSDRPITGSATFNVAPEAAGAYFNKLQCFCFTEQTIQPGETVEMPVSFFVDPEIINDRSASSITQITLSYTFYPVATDEHAKAPDPAARGAKSGG